MTQPHAVSRRSVLLALLCVGVVACNDDVSQFVFEARILDGDGGNPAAGTDATTLRIGIAEGELETVADMAAHRVALTPISFPIGS